MNILIAGDFCPIYRVKDLIELENYEMLFGNVKSVIESADLSIVNLEAPVSEIETDKPILKQGANLKCTAKSLDALKYSGFSMVTLANNHFKDFGESSINQTLEACRKRSILYVGGGENIQEASKILYKVIENKCIAFINCCEHEFSIATESIGGCNPLNVIQQFYAIQEARKKADYIVVIVHGGHEYYQYPSLRMKENYHFFIDVGADVVVNHHQHCYSGYEIYKNKPIFYGLGNFCFDRITQHFSNWHEGFLLLLSFSDANIEFELIPYIQCWKEPTILLLKEKEDFERKIYAINQIIRDDILLRKQQFLYYSEDSINYRIAFEPYNNRITRKMFKMKLLPSFLTRKKNILLSNIIECESHRDKVLYCLKTNLK